MTKQQIIDLCYDEVTNEINILEDIQKQLEGKLNETDIDETLSMFCDKLYLCFSLGFNSALSTK